jgi:hypothetical protein
MRKILCAASLAGLALLAARPARADDKPDPNAILDKAIKALGGEATLEKYKAATWKGKGTFHTGTAAIAYTGEWAVQAPDRYKAVLSGEANGMTFKRVRVVDGDKGWTKADDGPAEDMAAGALAEARRELFGQWVTRLVPLRDRAFTLAAAGPTKVGDAPAVGLKVTAKDGGEFHLYFDRDSGLLLKAESRVKQAGADQEVKQEVLYDDYQETDGLKHARKITVKRDGRTVVEQEITDYQPAEKLDAKEFAKP